MPRIGTTSLARAGTDFESPEVLRAVLVRLHQAGPGAWRHDPEATELMRHATNRYAALARTRHVEPEDAAVAAFEAMRLNCTRTASNPWAVVTKAVTITLMAEERAAGLLTSADRARRAEVSKNHDCVRFSDREHLIDYHPALQIRDSQEELDQPSSKALAERAIDTAARVLIGTGWSADVAYMAVDYVCSRLADAGDRHAAYDGLRKDKAARAQFDLTHRRWIGMLRFLLGHPTSPSILCRLGVLARVLGGDTIEELLADKALLRYITQGTAAVIPIAGRTR